MQDGGTNWNERLFEAAMNGKTEQAREALDNGANIEAVDEESRTAFMIAAQYNKHKILELLFTRGAVFNPEALDVAAFYGHYSVVEFLINKTDLEISDDMKMKAIIRAALQNQDLNILKLLLKHFPNITDEQKTKALIAAIQNGRVGVIEFLLDAKNTTISKDQINAALISAVRCDKEPLVMRWIRNGADPFFRDKDNKTALDYAKDENIKKIIHEAQKSLILKYGLVSVVGLAVASQIIPLEPLHAAGVFSVFAAGTSAMSYNSNGLNSQVCSALSSCSVALALYFVKSAIPEEYRITARIVKLCGAVAMYSTYNTLFPSMPEESKGQEPSM